MAMPKKRKKTRAEDISPTSQDIKRGDLKERLRELSPLSTECCIYSVPKRLLKKNNGEAYMPQLVSIGPLHHGKESLLAMEEHKLRYVQSFLDRTGKSIDYYVNVVKGEWEERARHSYAETIEFQRDEFVDMILMDGIFIIVLFLRSYFDDMVDETDRIFHKPWIIDDLLRDMILLENQLPFFVLEGLFNLAFGGDTDGHVSIELSHNFFTSHVNISQVPDTTSTFEVKHFVDLLRTYYLPTYPRASPTDKEKKFIFRRSATELHKAGVEFEINNKSNCLLHLQFTDSWVLQIPHLLIDEHTESILRNLVAFEQCHHDENRYISDYVYLMDCLINTPEDVDLFAEKEIIENWLGDNANAATLFNDLSNGVILIDSTVYYTRLCEDLNAYCKARRHEWWATLKRDYFGSPWRTTSTTAAIVFLVLTFIQTICSVLSLVL